MARLTVQAVRDAVARSRVSTLSFQASRGDDDLLQSLLGFTALTSRNTVMPFVVAALKGSDGRTWLVDRLRVAVTKPQFTPRAYQPVDKRIDHWMATYSFNLMLLTLACGAELSAAELFADTDDPAGLLRDTALQWRAAVPNAIWLNTLEHIDVIRGREHDGRRDIRLAWKDERSDLDHVDVLWLNDIDTRSALPDAWFVGFDNIGPAIRSMHLAGSLSEDLLRHAVEPLLFRHPASVTTAVYEPAGGTRTIAHSMIRLWITTAFPIGPQKKPAEYRQAITPLLMADNADIAQMMTSFLRCLAVDARDLPAAEVRSLLGSLALPRYFRDDLHGDLVRRCEDASAVSGS